MILKGEASSNAIFLHFKLCYILLHRIEAIKFEKVNTNSSTTSLFNPDDSYTAATTTTAATKYNNTDLSIKSGVLYSTIYRCSKEMNNQVA